MAGARPGGGEGRAMASKDTGQRTTRRSGQDEELTEEQADTGASERKDKLDDDIDAILDEIDETLEANSEDVVRSFVQKGGQ